MHLEKRNPSAAQTAAGVSINLAKINVRDITSIYPEPQCRVAARLAARFGLSLSVALVVASLAGIGEVAK